MTADIDAAINEFNFYGNPAASKKIITVNNCKHTVQEGICTRISLVMNSNDIESIVIIVTCACNVISPNDNYLPLF